MSTTKQSCIAQELMKDTKCQSTCYGDRMNIGDLVTDNNGTIGIIIAQVGVIDRWIIKWIDSGETSAQWGGYLFHL